jgi:membrane protein YdbS with pleckstrin-like domain
MANDVQVINNGGTDGYLRLNKKCMLSMYISNAITYVLILIAFVLMTEYARDLLGPAHDVVWTLGIVLLVLVLVYLVVAPPIYYARYRYRLTEDRVDVRYGIVV